MKFKIGNKVKIIQRKPGNTYGGVDYDKPNGDVGSLGYVTKDYEDNSYKICEKSDGSGMYYGIFDYDELELIEDEFVLPEKWYIELKSQEEFDVFLKWSVENEYLKEYHLNSEVYKIPYYCSFNNESKYVGYNSTNTYKNYTQITFEQFKKYVLKNVETNEVMNTYGLKVGDKLPQEVISQWVNMGKNRCHINNGVWEKTEGIFLSDRQILSFKLINGIVGFEVSDTTGVYLRAEGFKEFMDNFNKPKFEVGKWYKYNSCYIKFKEFKYGDIFVASDDIIHNKYDGRGGYYGRVTGCENNYRLLTDLSEIQQYLPDGHPDKIKPMEKNEFKKGDYIVITYCDFPSYEGKLNYCYKLIDNEFRYASLCKIPLNEPHRKKARYATPEEIAEYDRLNEPYDVTTLEKLSVPLNIRFYVKYSDEFTEDLYNKLNEWCKNNTKGKIRGYADSFEGFKREGFYVFNNWGLNKYTSENYHNEIKGRLSYGVDNNSQDCRNEFSIVDVKLLINYKNETMDDLIEEAKRRYPVGTKFIIPHLLKVSYVKHPNFYLGNSNNIYCASSKNISDFEKDGYNGCVYYNGKWAEILKEESKSLVGRYLKALVDRPQGISRANKGDLFLIIEEKGNLIIEYLKDGSSGWGADKECIDTIWELMPEGFEPPKDKDLKTEEKWLPKIGEWAICIGNNRKCSKGSSSGWEKGLVFQITDFYNDIIWGGKNGDGVWFEEGHIRKAELHEIPKTEDLPMAKPDEYTAEEALAELKRRGFKQGVEYTYMYSDGEYDEDAICIAETDPQIKSTYIDCGRGYLWHIKNPSILHKGPISAPTYNDYPLTLNEVFSSEEFNKPNYLKPETLLPKTTLNY